MAAFATASYLAFAVIVTSADDREHSRQVALVLYVVSTTLAIYMGLIAVLVVAPQVALVPFVRRDARAILVAVALVAVCCLPLLVMALDRGSGQLFWVPKPDDHVLGQAARALTSAGYEPNVHRAALANLTLVLTGALLVLSLVVIAASGRGRMPYGGRAPELLIAFWFVVPVLLALIAAKAGVPVELSRTTLLVLPAVALLLAWLFAHPRIPSELGWVCVIALLAARAAILIPSYGVSPEPWNAATASVLASARTGACVAFYPQDARMPFDYYLDAGAAGGADRLRPVFPAAPWTAVVPYVERYLLPSRARLDAIVRACPVLWFVSSHQGQRAGPPTSQADYRRYRAFLAALALRYTRQRADRFGWAAVIRTVRFSHRALNARGGIVLYGSPTSSALRSHRALASASSRAAALGSLTFSSTTYSPVSPAASSESASHTSDRAPRSGERMNGPISVVPSFRIPPSFFPKPVRTTPGWKQLACSSGWRLASSRVKRMLHSLLVP